MADIFQKRVNYKPFEYPEVLDFVKTINNTFWVHEELSFTADVQDFNVKLNEAEKELVKRALLGIAQLEVNVGTFWNHLYDHFPKPEFNIVGSTFAENEARHAEAYSRLLEVLGLNEEFEKIPQYPAFEKKLQTVEKAMDNTSSSFAKMLYFTLVVENITLFGQFANILSFTRFTGSMKNIANIVQWTALDEIQHIYFGIYLIKELLKEGHTINQEELREEIQEFLAVELEFMDWVYEKGENTFFSKKDMEILLKYRIDDALNRIGFDKIYNITQEQYKNMTWFDEEIYANTMDDFFAKRPVDYTKKDKSITSNDLF